MLNSIFEADFHGLSYGFRPGRSAHMALQAVQTALQKGRRSLSLAREWCQAHLHRPLLEPWTQLSAKLEGDYEYYGIRGNLDALKRFRAAVRGIWIGTLLKRSRKSRLKAVVALVDTHFALPTPRIAHPDDWLPVSPGYLPGRAGCGKSACPDLRGRKPARAWLLD